MKDILKRAEKLAIQLAKQAGKFQIAHLGKIERIEYKNAINPVTDVDKKCEAMIVAGIRKHFPEHDILAEEGSDKKTAHEYCWVIDPLDGTVNFAHGFPIFCVSIALLHYQKPVMGVVFDPNHDELFTAIHGQGAKLNGKLISVSKVDILRRALLATGFAYNVQEETRLNNLDHFCNFIKRAQAVRRPGAAAIDLCWVACGRLDGFWELFLKPWDMAAGVLILREAGGKVTSMSGGAFDLYGDEIVASNKHVHQQMIEVFHV